MSVQWSTARAMTRLRRAVPQWPFISPDGRAGGFVRSASGSPGHGGAVLGNEEGVFAGPFSGRPQRLDCAVPNVPPVLDSTGRVVLLCHSGPNGPGAGSGGTSHLCLARLDRLGDAPAPLAQLAGTVQQLLWDEPAHRVLALVAEPGADTAALTSGRRPSIPRGEPEVDEGPAGGQSVWSVSLATGRRGRAWAGGSVRVGDRLGAGWVCGVRLLFGARRGGLVLGLHRPLRPGHGRGRGGSIHPTGRSPA